MKYPEFMKTTTGWVHIDPRGIVHGRGIDRCHYADVPPSYRRSYRVSMRMHLAGPRTTLSTAASRRSLQENIL